MIIDFRLRPPLRSFPQALMFNLERGKRIAESQGMYQPKSMQERSIELLFQEMDKAGVVKGVVPGRYGNSSMGNVPPADINAVVEDYPDRFIGAIGIDPSNVDEAVGFAEKYVVRGKMKAIGMEPGTVAEPLMADDRKIYPLYDYCERNNVPIIMMLGGNAGPDITYTHPVQADHVARDFPKLKIIISHGGWPWVQQILHVAYRRLNVYLSPDMYLFNLPGWQDYVTAANYFLQDRFLYGSSYPFLPVEACAEAFCKLPFRAEVLPKLVYKNAINVLELE